MGVKEPSWNYRQLFGATKEELQAITDEALKGDIRDAYVTKAWGVVGLWLRLTQDCRNPDDLSQLEEMIIKLNDLFSDSSQTDVD